MFLVKYFVFVLPIWCPDRVLTLKSCEIDEVPSPENLIQLTKIVGNLTSLGIINQDLYITRWLRVANGNVITAETLLQKDLQFRAKYKMPSILNENWSEFEDLFPYSLKTFDKCGHPVLYLEVGNWDMRNAVLTGRSERLLRYWIYIYEKEFALLSKLHMENKNISFSSRVYDYENYNFLQHGCTQCGLVQFRFNELVETHYSHLVQNVFFVNTPSVVQTAYQITASAGMYTQDMVNRMENLGYDRRYYLNVLLKYIDKHQLPQKYGGSFTSKGDNKFG